MYDLKIINEIKDLLLKRRETIATAESVTSGHLQAAISLADGATEIFQGGITTYNIDQKVRHLHIDHAHALSCNCVSQKVADEMATNAIDLFKSDWAIAITGYATPVPDLGIEQLFAFCSVSYKGRLAKSELIKVAKDEALKVQVHYANAVLKSFRDFLASAH